ncbi:hypothetical protein M0804_002251 [Polistes exclamans]|nr:hypothetical protein M0804_002251 [Polistes exclamans]
MLPGFESSYPAIIYHYYHNHYSSNSSSSSSGSDIHPLEASTLCSRTESAVLQGIRCKIKCVLAVCHTVLLDNKCSFKERVKRKGGGRRGGGVEEEGIATRPWSPDQGKTREMTKLCNHKRKLLLPSAAASPVAASCTLPVSSSTLSSGPTPSTATPTATAPIHADSPTSPDKTRKGTF